jgi:hypothetical protein
MVLAGVYHKQPGMGKSGVAENQTQGTRPLRLVWMLV